MRHTKVALMLGFLMIPVSAFSQEAEKPIKVVPVRFCIIDTGDTSAQNGRLNINNLTQGLRQKNAIWAQCRMQFRLNRNAVDFVADPLLPPSGVPGDIVDPSTLPGALEYLLALLSCNRKAGADAKEKLTEVFIRSFVDATGARLPNILGATIKPEPCRKPFVAWKPVVIDPNWFPAASRIVDFGRDLAHEDGHALSLDHSLNMGDLMFPALAGGGLALSDAECGQARAEGQKISGTVDKNKKGRPIKRDAPRSRSAVGHLTSPPRPEVDIAEHVVTVEHAKKLLTLASILAAPAGPSDKTFVYRFMVDADADPRTGGDPGTGFGFQSQFHGAELYAEMEVRYDPQPRILSSRAFVFQGNSFVPASGVRFDIAAFPIVTTERAIPGIIVIDVDLSFKMLPTQLKEGFRSMSTAGEASSPNVFDESPIVLGSITPFDERTLITLSKVSGPPGTSIKVKGKNFAPNSEVEISINTEVISRISTDKRGEFKARIVVPSMPAGPVSIMAIDKEFASDAMIFRLVP